MLIIIVVILLVAVAFAMLRYYYQRCNMSTDNSSYDSITGGSKDHVPEGLIPRDRFPQVGVLTNDILKKYPLDDFVWLEKTDGQHQNVYLLNDAMYVVNKDAYNKVDTGTSGKLSNGQTELDTELYDGKYYVFDASMIEGVDVSNLSYAERMNVAKTFLSKHGSLNRLFVMKDYAKIPSLEYLISYLDNEYSPTTHNKIDGVVLQHVSLPYFGNKGSYTCFKLKRSKMNTVDFRLRYERSLNKFYLYLFASKYDLIHNCRRLPMENSYSIRHTGLDLRKLFAKRELPDAFYLLFASPFYEGMHELTPRTNWSTDGFFKSEIAEINELMSQLIDDPEKFDDRIVECAYADDGWVPMRIRDNKLYSNGYRVGLSNVAVMFSPVDPSAGKYFAHKLAFSEELLNIYHDANHMLRKYIIETTFEAKTDKRLSVLDIAGGRGGDFLDMYYANTNNIIALDADAEALTKYVSKVESRYKYKHEYLTKVANIKPSYVSLNVLQGMLDSNNDPIIDQILAREECPKQGFDIILMNWAIHYLCDSHEKVVALGNMVKRLLKPGGKFIFTTFDGSRILRKLDSDNELHLVTFDISIISSNDGITIARMPLPTIDESGYREEPLFTEEFLSDLESCGLVLTNSFYPAKCVKLSDDPKYDAVSDYLRFIITHTMILPK